ncbi:MAG: HAD-IIIC family phosphatase, partial [Treponema sp.]
MRELEYPFNSAFILKKTKSLKRKLLTDNNCQRLKKKIAVLGGSTTQGIVDILELFLLNYEIEPLFYQSEYNQYFTDVMFDNQELVEFNPDLIFIHTSTRNIKTFPTVRDAPDDINAMIENECAQFEAMWTKIEQRYHCPIIQNNFEQPFYRLMGNKDVSDVHGRTHFINQLNEKFYSYSQLHENFYINDINYMASCYGLQQWADPSYWHLYKYVLAVNAIPELAFNVANIIKSIYGKNKKAFVLDLDNTLWGGIVGDDGAENIEIGQETPIAQLYSEVQTYIKAHKDLGILLTVNSKNEEENALAGLNRPDSILKPEDFITIKANWESKDLNLIRIAKELNIGEDSMVFVDDNPAERAIVKAQISSVSVPEMTVQDTLDPAKYITILDRSGFFEVTQFSKDDLKRNEMYKANAERAKIEASFSNYEDYLLSLNMKAEIQAFNPLYMSRIAQLTNKSNQFNLTTKRCSQSDIENIAANPSFITLYGKLEDKFGDNGVVSVVFGHYDKDKPEFHIDLWLM